MTLFRFFLIIFLAITIALFAEAQFNIPLPFGNLSFNKRPDGTTEVTANQNVNILGWGGNRGIKFVTGNGTFSTETEGGILANGTNFGGNSTFGVDKEKGVTLDTDVNLANETVQGGLGKESGFLGGLVQAFKNLKNKKENKN